MAQISETKRAGGRITGHGLAGIVLLLAGLMLPVTPRKKAPQEFEDWPEAQSAQEDGRAKE